METFDKAAKLMREARASVLSTKDEEIRVLYEEIREKDAAIENQQKKLTRLQDDLAQEQERTIALEAEVNRLTNFRNNIINSLDEADILTISGRQSDRSPNFSSMFSNQSFDDHSSDLFQYVPNNNNTASSSQDIPAFWSESKAKLSSQEFKTLLGHIEEYNEKKITTAEMIEIVERMCAKFPSLIESFKAIVS